MKMHGYLLAVAAMSLLAAGCGSSGASSRDLHKADGHRLYLSCSGTGKPTVVLEAGLASDHSIWEKVTRKIGPLQAQVCMYDRYGLGRSDGHDSPPETRSVAEIDSDLHALLENAGIEPPYVLVSHSMGGLISRAYASRYPEQVAGMVMLDTVPDDFDDFIGTQIVQSGNESIDIGTASADLRAHDSVGSKPVAVIQAGNDSDLAQLVAGTTGRSTGFQRYWSARQRALTRISTDSVFAVARGSSHNIPLDNPKLTLEAIRLVVDSARERTHLPKCPTSRLPVLGGICDASSS
jgi:pimeloyl-ACP methyl ester carboxylesterase